MGQYRPAISGLFVSVAKRKEWVLQNTILLWIRLVISHMYKSASNDDCRLARVMSHKVGKILASLLFKRNLCNPASIED